MRDEAPALVWPSLLELPSARINIVYLDLNHWIYLSQACVGHPAGPRYKDALNACRAARSAGTAMFVLSNSHYIEMLKIKDPAQRRAIADIMEELTDFASLVNRNVVMELEFIEMVDRITRHRGFLPRIALIGRGVRHANGRQSGFRIMGPSGDATDQVRNRMGPEAFEKFIIAANLGLERSALRGPTDDEVGDLRAHGWNPEAVSQVAENRAAEERNQSMRLDNGGSWRRSRLRDIVSARELIIEFDSILARARFERGRVLSNLISDPESARAFVRAMPSTEVSIELKTAWHRNRDKPWTANDIHDIDAMSLAVPYCDIVVTEKACHHALRAAHLDKRMHTLLLRSLKNLPDALGQWRPKRAPES